MIEKQYFIESEIYPYKKVYCVSDTPISTVEERNIFYAMSVLEAQYADCCFITLLTDKLPENLIKQAKVYQTEANLYIVTLEDFLKIESENAYGISQRIFKDSFIEMDKNKDIVTFSDILQDIKETNGLISALTLTNPDVETALSNVW